MCDHYMAPLSLAQPALDAIKAMQDQALKMGIPLRTRHREVAPNQYEMAPLFGSVTTQIDQNVWAMQLIEEMAAAHGLAALLQEKPFNDVNGSGKHNNWSIGTACGTNLLNVGQLAKASGSTDIFPVSRLGCCCCCCCQPLPGEASTDSSPSAALLCALR